jgi:hypothetical protein
MARPLALNMTGVSAPEHDSVHDTALLQNENIYHLIAPVGGLR